MKDVLSFLLLVIILGAVIAILISELGWNIQAIFT